MTGHWRGTGLEQVSWSSGLGHPSRDFELDLKHCPNCGAGELKIIAAVPERTVIEKVLGHLGLQTLAAPCAPARGPQPQAA